MIIFLALIVELGHEHLSRLFFRRGFGWCGRNVFIHHIIFRGGWLMLWWSISHILLFMEIINHWFSIDAETFVRQIKFVLFRTCSFGRVFTTFGLLLCPIRKLLSPNLFVVIVHIVIFSFVVSSLNWWNHGVRRTWYKFVTFQVHFVIGRLFLLF